MRKLRRAITMVVAIQFGAIGLVALAQGQSAGQNYQIGGGDLGAALKQLAIQSHLQIIYSPELVQGKSTRGLIGSYVPAQSLQKLLAGSGLSAEAINASTFVLTRVPLTSPLPEKAAQLGAPSRKSPKELAGVTVTGNLRRESFGHYAGSITPVTEADLEQIGANSMEDYIGSIPGVSFAAMQPGFSNITIRGISTTTGTDQGQQTTGLYIDGIPLTEAYFNVATPDIDTFDVNRVEVMKGPQGTAFGTGAMGGAVNFILNKAQVDGFDDRIQLGIDQVDGNGALGHVVKTMFNVPITSDFAVRVVLDDRRDPGYIDNIGTHQDNSNTSDVFGGRILTTWAINDATTVSGMTLYQRIRNADAFNDVSTAGMQKNDTAFPSPFDTSTLINSLNFKHQFGWADLMVNTSSHVKTQHSDADGTSSYGSLLGGLSGPVHLPQAASANGNSAEVRLTSNSVDALEWLVGFIYDETIINYNDSDYASEAANAIDIIYGHELGGVLAHDDVFETIPLRVRGQQSSLYSQVSWNFDAQWKLTLGGRYYATDVDSRLSQAGLLNYLLTGSTAPSALIGRQRSNGYSPMGSLAYLVNNRVMLYGLISTGYRFGGLNDNPPQGTASTPATFGPDKLTNYEMGLRTSNETKTLAASVTAYFIDWKNIQVRTTAPNALAYAINAGSAYIYGTESSVSWQPTKHFQWKGSLAFNCAKLDEPYEQYVGRMAPPGTPLPGSSKWQASSVASYNLGGPLDPFITATYLYRSKATVDLFDLEPKMGNYSIFGLRAGLTAAGVTYTAYVENIGNRKAISNITLVSPTLLDRYYVAPRTIGLLADFSF